MPTSHQNVRGNLVKDYLKILSNWPRFAEQYWYDCPDRPDLGCFGTGYNHWGVQTNQKFVGAYAVLATDPGFDSTVVGFDSDFILQRALKALRFSLASHITGEYHRLDDYSQWGHTEISALGIERMMHGVDAISAYLTDADREAIKRVLVSEADFQLHFEVTGTRWAKEDGNHPESNYWNGAMLARTAMMYPEHPHAALWQERANLNLVNAISIEADAVDCSNLEGRPVYDWHLGSNFFRNYGLDHHGYLNVGYMIICLSNAAMLHFGYRLCGKTPPATIYHHVEDLWKIVKQFIFEDGRLIRIGGDTRQRYCYCQDYLLPTLVFVADHFGDPCAEELEWGALDLIQTEQSFNGDGSFLSQRCSSLEKSNPYCYIRLESDKAVVLSQCAYWRRALSICSKSVSQTLEDSVAGSWEEPEHGAVFHRSATRVASWSWRASEAPQGLCLPPTTSHLGEWCENMGGRVRLAGEQGKPNVLRYWQRSFTNGFLTVGVMSDNTYAFLPDGWETKGQIMHWYAVAALPDNHSMVVLEYATLNLGRSYLTEVKGLKLNIPNDLFNGMKRTYFAEDGEHIIEGYDSERDIIQFNSKWINVDNIISCIGVYGADGYSLYRPGKRRACLYYDELCFPCMVDTQVLPSDKPALDCGSVVVSAVDKQWTRNYWAEGNISQVSFVVPGLRGVWVRSYTERTYLLMANFGPERSNISIDLPEGSGSARDIVTEESSRIIKGKINLQIESESALLIEIIRR